MSFSVDILYSTVTLLFVLRMYSSHFPVYIYIAFLICGWTTMQFRISNIWYLYIWHIDHAESLPPRSIRYMFKWTRLGWVTKPSLIIGTCRAVISLLGTGTRGPMNWENYRHFGGIGKNCTLFEWRTKLKFSFKFTAL